MSLRLRVTTAVILVLAVMLGLTSVAVNAIFVAQSNQSLDALLDSRVQLARQLARAGVGGQQIVNRTETDGVRAYLVLRNGTEFGSPPPTGLGIRSTTVTLNAPGRVDGAELTLTIDTALVTGARQRLRRILVVTSLVALVVSALLVAGAVRVALRPLDSMAALAKTITEGNRGRRLAPTRTDTEIGQTARAFDEMLDELEGAESRARQAEERTRAFLADAAHELRTPITGVLAAAETLLHHGDQLPAADREKLQSLLIREAQRAGTLISDLLAAARLDAGVELDLAPVSLGQLAYAELDRVRLLHPETTVTTSGQDVLVTADAGQVSGILRNLIENAMRAAGPGGRIHLNLDQHGGFAVAEVWDSGPGVPPSERERIFERLVRLDHSRTSDAGGSGLGLAIARGYARAHGGDLVCADPGGPGALFRLTLPIEPPTAAAPDLTHFAALTSTFAARAAAAKMSKGSEVGRRRMVWSCPQISPKGLRAGRRVVVCCRPWTDIWLTSALTRPGLQPQRAGRADPSRGAHPLRRGAYASTAGRISSGEDEAPPADPGHRAATHRRIGRQPRLGGCSAPAARLGGRPSPGSMSPAAGAATASAGAWSMPTVRRSTRPTSSLSTDIAVTSIARTVLDLARTLADGRGGRRWVIEPLRLGLSPGTLAAGLLRMERWPGVRQARRAVDFLDAAQRERRRIGEPGAPAPRWAARSGTAAGDPRPRRPSCRARRLLVEGATHGGRVRRQGEVRPPAQARARIAEAGLFDEKRART